MAGWCVVLLAGLVAGVILLDIRRDPAAATAASDSDQPAATIERRDLVNRERVDGTLGYAPLTATLTANRAGSLTALAAEGTVVRRGGSLFAVDGEPVLLMIGATPSYRDLVEGMRGTDVRVLKANLVALHLATWHALGDNDRFTSATSDAVRRLQGERGLEVTGVITQGDVVVLPTAVRVGAHKVEVGATSAAGMELSSITTDRRVVTVKLAAARQALVHVGNAVEVELPDGPTTRGTVTAISSLAKTVTGSGNDSTTSTTVDMTVSLERPRETGTIDQSPVKVAITTAESKGVLAVPVSALLALAGGGYGVQVVGSDKTTRLVGVTTGLFSDGDNLVEVSGDIRVGDTVVVSQ